MAKAVGFTREAAGRVADAVRRVEGTPVDESGGGWYPFRSDEGDSLRLGKTSAQWTKGTSATIPIWESGSAGAETQTTGTTVVAYNKFATVASGKWVMLGKAGNGTWYLISAEC